MMTLRDIPESILFLDHDTGVKKEHGINLVTWLVNQL